MPSPGTLRVASPEGARAAENSPPQGSTSRGKSALLLGMTLTGTRSLFEEGGTSGSALSPVAATSFRTCGEGRGGGAWGCGGGRVGGAVSELGAASTSRAARSLFP